MFIPFLRRAILACKVRQTDLVFDMRSQRSLLGL